MIVLFLGTALCIDHNRVGLANINELHKARQEKKEIQQKMAQKDHRSEDFLAKIEESRKQIIRIAKEVKPLEMEYLLALEEKNRVEALFRNRMCELYKKGEGENLKGLLSAPSLQDFLNRLMVIGIITKQDHRLVELRRKALEEVERRKSVYDNRINEQQKHIEDGKRAYIQLQKQIKDDHKGMELFQRIEEMHREELIEINLKEWKSGALRFPYIGKMKYPTKGTRETSSYGRRVHPITGGKAFHHGIDYAGSRGTPVYAAADGVVVLSQASSGYGWKVMIYHGEYKGNSVFSCYAHSYPWQVKVVVGQQVYAGKTVVTGIGSNGQSTGDHLHFEVRYGRGDNAPSDNPKNWLE